MKVKSKLSVFIIFVLLSFVCCVCESFGLDTLPRGCILQKLRGSLVLLGQVVWAVSFCSFLVVLCFGGYSIIPFYSFKFCGWCGFCGSIVWLIFGDV